LDIEKAKALNIHWLPKIKRIINNIIDLVSRKCLWNDLKMGRIKTTLIKRTGKKLLSMHPDKFKSDFNENKKAVEEVADIPSKKLRNVLAGYLTRLVRKEQQKS